ncbi:patatin-like phospholipase family protein [Rhodobacteraceae bacterium]|nr:patatin-like phospholipase family protein [Paracoccaceae bacterium]
MPTKKSEKRTQKAVTGRNIEKSVNIALQGGGSHGAFTWGVLDKLFEDDRLWIQSISGTSAGAMNTVVASQGMYDGGAVGARKALRAFWKDVSDAGKHSPIKRSPLDMMMGNWDLEYSPGYRMMDMISRMSSPYDFNMVSFNPLRKLILDHVDFDMMNGCADGFTMFISATNVETGRVRIFKREELTVDAVLASACLPSMFQAVEIDGQHYWDGGYMGNPVLSPFKTDSPVDDTLIVQINPIVSEGVPKTAQQIQNRVNEISFNASLLKELRVIRDMNNLISSGELDAKRHRSTRLHVIEAQDRMAPLGASSKMNTEWAFLEHLFDIGRDAAGTWLAKNYDSIGKQSTFDLDALFADT